MASRIEYPKGSTYSNKVLTGPWFYDRLNKLPDPETYETATSIYQSDYVPLPAAYNPAAFWDQKIRAEDSNFIPQVGRDETPNFFENFTTTYDLAFNHFPKCFKEQINRSLRFRLERYEPLDDYIGTFGNLTNFGLRDYKKEEWECGVSDPRRNITTQYQDCFVKPDETSYRFKRFGTPLPNSTGMQQSVNTLKLRNLPICNVPDNDKLVPVPQPSHFNPITWECIPETKPMSQNMYLKQNTQIK